MNKYNLMKLGIYKKKGEKGVYYAVYSQDLVGTEDPVTGKADYKMKYTLIGFLSEGQLTYAQKQLIKEAE